MGKLWEKWKKVAEKIGNFQAEVIFSILYVLLILPTGLISSLFNDFLQIRRFPVWQKMENNASTFKKLKQQ